MIFFGAFLLVLQVVAAASLHRRNQPIPPSQDPFYTAPPGFQNAAPGQILRARLAPGNLSSIAGAAYALNLLYRTSDSNFAPSWAVTTLFVPAKPKKVLLSYQFPEDSVDIDGAPSFLFYHPGDMPADINNAVAQGWIVNVPDYEGPFSQFTVGIQEGLATLDSVRAALKLFPVKNYAMWGYSGGTIASEWAAELVTKYAPELKFSGMAIGGTVANLTASLETINGGTFASLVASALIGLSRQNPAANQFLMQHLIPATKDQFLAIQKENFFDAIVPYAGQNIFSYFDNDILHSQPIQQVISTNGIMGTHGVPPMQTFFYHAINDELIPIQYTDALVNKYCAAGAKILYKRNSVGTHLPEAFEEDSDVFQWLVGVLENGQTTTGCTIQNVTITGS